MQKMSGMFVIIRAKFYANSFIFVGLFLEHYAKYLESSFHEESPSD